MKKIPIIILISFLIVLNNCDIDKCRETEAPEINFELIIYGKVEVKSLQTGEVVTSEWEGLEINAIVTKYYCDGTARGPFETPFKTDNAGNLINLSIGTWSYRMDNEEDYMRIVFFCQGMELGKLHAYYTMLKEYDGGPANLQFKIDITWDYQNSKIHSSFVNLL